MNSFSHANYSRMRMNLFSHANERTFACELTILIYGKHSVSGIKFSNSTVEYLSLI